MRERKERNKMRKGRAGGREGGRDEADLVKSV